MTAKNSLLAQVQSLVAEVFQVEPEIITRDTELGTFPQWDSMGHMDLMVALEEGFGIPISADTISQLTAVSVILSYIQEKKND